MSYLELPDLTQEEKFILWKHKNANKYAKLRQSMGIDSSRFSVLINRGDIPPWLHKALLEKGVPFEVLPPPVKRKPGPRKKT